MNAHYARGLQGLFDHYAKATPQKDPKKVKAGRLGGKAGHGKAKARKVSSAQMRRVALARWGKQNSHTK